MGNALEKRKPKPRKEEMGMSGVKVVVNHFRSKCLAVRGRKSLRPVGKVCEIWSTKLVLNGIHF